MTSDFEQPRLAAPRGGRKWLATLLVGSAAVAIGIAAFFFLAVALVVGSVLAAIIALRFWWRLRALKRKAARSGPLEGEYSVVAREETAPPNDAERRPSR